MGHEVPQAASEPTPQTKTLAELHDDIEAALFAAQDLRKQAVGSDALGAREKAIIVTELETALLWTKRAIGNESSPR